MPPNNFAQTLIQIQSATHFSDIFPTTQSTDSSTQLRDLKRHYHKWANLLHPDLAPQQAKTEATEQFTRLTQFYNQACAQLHGPIFKSATATHTTRTKITQLCDAATCYLGTTSIGDATHRSFIKVAANPQDNDLLATEASAIETIYAQGNAARAVFFPRLLDTFGVMGVDKRVRVNVFAELTDFVSLAQVKQVYPDGVHPLDMAWMWRRLVWALDFAHTVGLIHGAVVPQNIMIHPQQHGLVLVDWCFSVRQIGADYPKLKAIARQQHDWYPNSVFTQQPPTPALDLSLAARSMIFLLGGNPVTTAMPSSIPPMMMTYFHQMSTADQYLTAADAGIQFDQLLERLGEPYFPRQFRPFHL